MLPPLDHKFLFLMEYNFYQFYDYFDSVDNGIGAHVRLHCHDRNTSVNKFVNQRNKGTVEFVRVSCLASVKIFIPDISS
jgi:hypothetical protein